jgi:pilus assembly protein CpaF
MNIEEREKLIKEFKEVVKNKIDINKDVPDDEVQQIVTDVIFNEAKKQYLSINDKREIINIIFNSIRKLDAIQPLIEDKTITEIMVNGPDNIFIEREGRVYKIDKTFESKEKLHDVIQNIVSRVNRMVNESSPIVDARLEDGSRVNVVLPPVALNGPILTIRKFPEKPMTVEELIRRGSLTEEAAEFLRTLVEAKYNIFISGGTGSGKTTFLNALSNFIPKDERVITIEDSAELQIVGVDNIVRLETKNANMEGKGAVTIRDLIKSSLRMRPERIVVGEVRGAEALDMLQAMNTGHDGSLSTGHSNSTKDMLSRLETMVLSGADFPLDAIRQQIASAIDIIIQLSRLRDKSRRTVEICEVLDYSEGKFKLNILYTFVEEGETEDRKIIGQLKRTENEIVNTIKLKMAGFSANW